MNKPDDSGFLSRWSRRKAEVRRGEPEPTPEAPGAGTLPPDTEPAIWAVDEVSASAAPAAAAAPAPPPPTLDDVAQLTRQSDFTRFVQRDVDPGVKNAAMKKLFTDPHFNVMDGLDVYIDDYNTPDPLPPGMLRQLAQSQLLGLFDHEKTDESASMPNTATATPAAAAAPEAPTAPSDEDLDLRLQPDDAAGPDPHGPGRAGPGEDPASQP